MRRDYVREEQALLASLHEASTLGNKYHHGNGTPIRLSGTSRMASTDTAAVGSAWGWERMGIIILLPYRDPTSIMPPSKDRCI